jgi:deoxyadenosine/deoxycytidine kinase
MLIAVEGLIGVGKSTLCSGLSAHLGDLGVEVLPEPVTSRTFATLLERYYDAPSRWGLTFQLDTIRSRVVAHKAAPEGDIVIQDRSIIGDQLFAQVARAQGFMDETEFAVYESLREALCAELDPAALVVYLRAGPETCMERIGQRARGCEHGIPMGYLQALYEAHERTLDTEDERCLVVDWESFGSVSDVALQIRERLVALGHLEGARAESYRTPELAYGAARTRSVPVNGGVELAERGL